MLGVVESVKAASDIYTPISGTVIEANGVLEDAPDKLNSDPYETWLAALKITDASGMDDLMDADEYRAFCEAEQE